MKRIISVVMIVAVIMGVMGFANAKAYKAAKKSFSIKSSSAGQVKVTLKKIKGAEKVAFRYKLKGKKWSKATVKANKKRTYKVKGLKSGKKYYFSVRYKKKGKWSKWSRTKSVRVKKKVKSGGKSIPVSTVTSVVSTAVAGTSEPSAVSEAVSDSDKSGEDIRIDYEIVSKGVESYGSIIYIDEF